MSKQKDKAFGENVLLNEEEIMKKEFFQPEPKTTRRRKTIKAEKKSGTKPRSFDEPVEKIAVELPKRLVKQLRILAAERESRFNVEAAAAFEMYLKELKAI